MSMSKSRPKIDNQSSIFDMLKQLSTTNKPTIKGELSVIERLRGALRSAVKGSLLSRDQIADEMSHLCGQGITKQVIDSWTREDQQDTGSDGSVRSGVSDGKTIRRHIPAEYLPAFCKVTHSLEPLRIMTEAAGFFLSPGPDALRAEIQRLDEEIRDAQTQKRVRVAFLKEMEKPKSF